MDPNARGEQPSTCLKPALKNLPQNQTPTQPPTNSESNPKHNLKQPPKPNIPPTKHKINKTKTMVGRVSFKNVA